ncbi:hypothetical protein CYLTODRAFT_398649 [Cylindrobasidium torrendii FP15055 ss-10]|uniref:FAD/NAD(P)-binding domain-containing protein n=1 Tax=Cylindrobasidium torrendii FP15055 ss-10 TaxID=1314674 RepID=A0A0D7B885_9AGAR|nr:hypothetical protein CYLTODRAFT_398649 [Cylindrobasidium torrendii FP15055 ss-10]
MSSYFSQAAACAGVAGALYVTSPAIWAGLRKRSIENNTAYFDMQKLGTSREASTKIPGTAVVCGGSIAGLITARVCHDHFERVLIIEPEAWLTTEEGQLTEAYAQASKRARIMQYDAYHGFHAFVYSALANLFPNFDEEAANSDVKVDRTNMDFRVSGVAPPPAPKYYGGNYPKRLWGSRRGLETLLRRLALDKKAYPNIEQVVGSVVSLVPDKHHSGTLAGVVYRDETGTTREIPAALIIDATGAAQAGQKWLSELGYAQDLHIQSYNPRAVYACIIMRVPPSFWDSLSHMPDNARGPGAGPVMFLMPNIEKENRAAVVVRNEHGFIHMIAAAWGSPDMPTTLDEYIAFVHSLHVLEPLPDWLFDFLDKLHEVEDTFTLQKIRQSPSSLLPYEKCQSLPDNFIALGDANCRINPIYGQGFAKVVTGASCLNTLLWQTRNDLVIPRNFGRKFFNLQAPKIQPFWTSPKLFDYPRPDTVPVPGEYDTQFFKFMRWYFGSIRKLARKDEQANLVIYRNGMMLDSAPIDLFHPLLVTKVFWRWLTGVA